MQPHECDVHAGCSRADVADVVVVGDGGEEDPVDCGRARAEGHAHGPRRGRQEQLLRVHRQVRERAFSAPGNYLSS